MVGSSVPQYWNAAAGASLFSLIIYSSFSFAASLTSFAQVLVVDELSMEESVSINFGVLENRDGTCSMDSSGNLAGVGGQTCSGISTPGEFKISGTEDQTIQVAVTSGTAVDGVNFVPAISGGDIYSLTSGETTIKVIGEQVLDSATLGHKSITYTLTANYQ